MRDHDSMGISGILWDKKQKRESDKLLMDKEGWEWGSPVRSGLDYPRTVDVMLTSY